MAGTLLRSPLHGWAAPLAEVPDPVFAEGMMGAGVAIDPFAGELFAPCDGEVIQLHRALHALTLRTAEGAEVLIHLGLETVALGGEGFEALVREGQRVSAGQAMIRFDLDLLARQAKSLISPVLVTNTDAFAVSRQVTGRVVQVGEALFEIQAIGAAAAEVGVGARGQGATRAVRIRHPHGLHARPAALIAAEVKRLGVPVEASLDGRKANARSPVALMGLGVRAGDELALSAHGRGADAALAALAELIERDINGAPAHEPRLRAPARSLDTRTGAIRGVCAAPGLVVGPAFHLVLPALEPSAGSGDIATETAALGAALATVRRDLETQAAAARGAAREILSAHLELIDDPELVETATAAVAGGRDAGVAWSATLRGQAERLRSLDDPRLAERAADLVDLERQVLIALGGSTPSTPSPPAGAIVLAEDLTPSQMEGLRHAGGVCTARGGPTSHVAILAAALGLPAVVAAGEAALRVAEGATVILDADAAMLNAAPTPPEIAEAQARATSKATRRAAAKAAALAPCFTADGVRIEVFANAGSLADAQTAIANGAEGCGLLRTEFLFLDRSAAPSEDEQADAYQAIAETFEGRPVIVRTLDIGSDKPAAWLALPPADNPALAVRGVRVGLRHPQLLKSQLRAILRVQPQGQCKIMVPMVASLDELRTVRRLADEAARELSRTEPFALGVMVETPAAAVTADLIAAEADFLSIGANDLAQYALAMDRTDPELAGEIDSLHPAVLRLIRLTVEGAGRHGRPVALCGAVASEPMAAPILIGLGVTELSAAPAAVPELKALIRTLTLDACRDLAARACAQASAAEVRALELRQPEGVSR